MTNQYSTGAHSGPGHNNPADAVVPEEVALYGGIGATLVVGVPLALIGIAQVLDVIGGLVWLLVAGYVVGLMVQYWTAKSYRDGLTAGELMAALVWPVDMLRTIRAGVKSQSAQPNAAAGHNNPADALIPEGLALWGGIGLTVFVGIPMVFWGIFSVLDLLGSLVWLAVVVYVVGLMVQYWISQAYRDGLTKGEILETLVWPVATIKSIREGVKARLNAAKP
jgi:hypothetical protein